jgi:N-acetylglucosamine kinase-like BadF-type ATPase
MFEYMIRLVADSGSTKTEWVGILGNDVVFKTHTPGLNPFQISDKEFVEIVRTVFAESTQYGEIRSLVFYGAGCTPHKIPHIQNLLQHTGIPDVRVFDDLQAVADGCLMQRIGVAAILGTGANSGYFENGKLIDKVPSLGYILGDEGSGASLGKALLHAYYNGLLPQEVMDAMHETFDMKRESILENVYRQPFPNRYLASFATFLHQHLHVAEIHHLARIQFEQFCQNQLLKYPNITELPIAISGSIGFHFRTIISEILAEHGITTSKFYQSPVEGLVAQMCASAE